MLHRLCLIFCLSLAGFAADNSDLVTIKTYESPGEEEYLTVPYSMCFSPSGELFVMDRIQARILVWDKDGKFDRAFGRKGEGPGEMLDPIKIDVTDDAVYLWEKRQFMTIYDHQGNYKDKIRIPGADARTFNVLSPDLFIIGYRTISTHGTNMIFELRNQKGERTKMLKTFKNESFLSTFEGSNKVTVKAFAPEIDIQRVGDGTWWYGFSQNKNLYKIDAEGKLIEKKSFEIPNQKPSDFEKELVQNMEFPMPNGQRLAMKNLPNLKVDFTHDKANYTHFLIKGDKVAFILTPIGTTDSIGNGYSYATYFINDMASGKTKARGGYHLPSDSVVLYRNGHAMAFVLNEKSEFDIREVTLKGF